MNTLNLSRKCARAVTLGCCAAVMTVSSGALHAQTDEISEAALACRDAASLLESDDIDAAREEALWCLEVIEQIRRDASFAVFPDSQGDWVGGEPNNQSAMGMTLLERTYTRGEQSIVVSITTGVAGSGLAALAQLGASLGSTLGVGDGNKFRVQRRSVVDMSADEGSVSYVVELRSAGVMNVQSSDTSAADVRAFLEDFPIAQIDDALKS